MQKYAKMYHASKLLQTKRYYNLKLNDARNLENQTATMIQYLTSSLRGSIRPIYRKRSFSILYMSETFPKPIMEFLSKRIKQFSVGDINCWQPAVVGNRASSSRNLLLESSAWKGQLVAPIWLLWQSRHIVDFPALLARFFLLSVSNHGRVWYTLTTDRQAIFQQRKALSWRFWWGTAWSVSRNQWEEISDSGWLMGLFSGLYDIVCMP